MDPCCPPGSLEFSRDEFLAWTPAAMQPHHFCMVRLLAKRSISSRPMSLRPFFRISSA